MEYYCYYCMNKMADDGVCEVCGHQTEPSPDVYHLPSGTVLMNRYLLGRVIGSGGFGITYIGRDLNLDIIVAVKEFFPLGYVNRNTDVTLDVTVTGDRNSEFFRLGKDKFIREARILAKFSGSRNIVDVRDFFECNNTGYIVMEYIRGITLQNYTKTHGLLDAEYLINRMKPIFKALDKIHKSGLIHRDISPDNIMMLDDGDLKLMDFGAAREVNFSDKKSLSIVLKPGYAPEEQYRSKGNQGPWTDVYAACATIYKCITGVTPDESTERAYSDGLKRPSAYGVNIPSVYEDAIMKGLSVYQEDRYQSIQELLDALEGEEVEQKTTFIFSSVDVPTDFEAGGGDSASEDHAGSAPFEDDLANPDENKADEDVTTGDSANTLLCDEPDELELTRREADLNEDVPQADEPQVPDEYETDRFSREYSGSPAPARQLPEPVPMDWARIDSVERADIPHNAEENAALSPGRKKLKKPVIAAVAAAAAAVCVVMIIIAVSAVRESKYQNAITLMNEGKYNEAVTAFEEMGGYKDSGSYYLECSYKQAEQYYADRRYAEAKELFSMLGDYEDSAEKVPACQYGIATDLYNGMDYFAAKTAFEELGDYEDSLTMVVECDYQQALILMASDESSDVESAISKLTDLGDYSDSPEQLRSAKLNYCRINSNNTDETTYAYLKELKDAGFAGASELYKELYSWTVTGAKWNTSESDRDAGLDEISKYSQVYFHFDLHGGTPGASIQLKYNYTYPSGGSGSQAFDEVSYNNQTHHVHWEDLSSESSGTLSIVILDSKGNELCSSSVRIVD